MKVKAELQKISDDIPECTPEEDVQPGGGGHTESLDKSSRGSGSQLGGAQGRVPLDSHGNDHRLRASRWVNEILITQSCDKRGSEGRAV